MLKIFILAFLVSVKAFASVFVGGGVGVTDGGIVEAGYKYNPFIAFRGRVGYLPSVDLQSLSGEFEQGSGNDAFANFNKLNFNSKTFDLGVEITPLPMLPILRGFKFIGAYQYMNTGIDASTSYNGSATFNGKNTLTVNGGIDIRISNQQKFAPYFGIGWDIINLPIISSRLTAGGTFRAFNARVTGIRGNVTTLVPQSDIDVEVAKLSKEINDKMFIPSVSLTIRATLPNIPFISFL